MDNSPNKYGGQQTKSKTSNTELRVADHNAGLAFDSPKFQVVGFVEPGSLSFTPSTEQTEVKHGTTAITHERHMAGRSAGFQCNVNETTRLVKEIQNMTKDMVPVFTPATQNFIESTILFGSTALQLSLDDATGATTNDEVWATWYAGTIEELVEERLIKNVVGDTVTLQRPFSRVPEPTTLLKRNVDTVTREGGTEYLDLTSNMKMTGNDSSVHILHHDSVTPIQGTKNPGSNSAVMGSQLQFAANALEYTGTGESLPVFSEEHAIPRNVARGIND